MMRLLKEEQRNAERSNKKSSTCVILWPSHLRMSILLCRHLRENLLHICVLFACRSIRMRSALAWRVNEVVSVIDRNVLAFQSSYLLINTQVVLCVFDCYIVFIYSYYTQQVFIYVIFLHNLFYNIVLCTRYFIINYLFL